MFGDYVLEKTSAKYDSRILFLDDEHLDDLTHYSADFLEHGYEVIHYKDDLSFRIAYENKVKFSNDKLIVLANSNAYVPYDLKKRLKVYNISLSRLFPKLNADVLHEYPHLNMDLLCEAYRDTYDDFSTRRQAEDFIQHKVYSQYNVSLYVSGLLTDLMQQTNKAITYRDWFVIAEQKAKIDVLAAQYRIEADTSEINRKFRDWTLANFRKLSTEISKSSPVLVSKAMEFMHDHSDKFVIIVMDGMSEFDWYIISRSFDDIPYEQSAAFAMIPTTTSVSRQCLLSNKYPSQLMEPWKQSKEKAEFIACAKSMGYSNSQIEYERGYDATFSSFVHCGAVIIMDVDEMVHAQHQGRLGMYNDIGIMTDESKLAEMTKRFLAQGFDVYISADHGNTPCRGLGKLMGTGVEVETKSRRMLVLKDFADKQTLIEKYGLIDYPKYYLKKDYDYLICEVGDSFDAKGEDVMTHGGISIDEGIVPFIKIKAGMANG